jgi:hypothetical protein
MSDTATPLPAPPPQSLEALQAPTERAWSPHQQLAAVASWAQAHLNRRAHLNCRAHPNMALLVKGCKWVFLYWSTR